MASKSKKQRRANSDGHSSIKQLKSEIGGCGIDLISCNMAAESVLHEGEQRVRNRSIFVKPPSSTSNHDHRQQPSLLALTTNHRKRSSLASELRDQSFTYIQNQIKNANVPIGTLFENEKAEMVME